MISTASVTTEPCRAFPRKGRAPCEGEPSRRGLIRRLNVIECRWTKLQLVKQITPRSAQTTTADFCNKGPNASQLFLLFSTVHASFPFTRSCSLKWRGLLSCHSLRGGWSQPWTEHLYHSNTRQHSDSTFHLQNITSRDKTVKALRQVGLCLFVRWTLVYSSFAGNWTPRLPF